MAGQLLAEASRTGRLSGDYVLHQLGDIDGSSGWNSCAGSWTPPSD